MDCEPGNNPANLSLTCVSPFVSWSWDQMFPNGLAFDFQNSSCFSGLQAWLVTNHTTTWDLSDMALYGECQISGVPQPQPFCCVIQDTGLTAPDIEFVGVRGLDVRDIISFTDEVNSATLFWDDGMYNGMTGAMWGEEGNDVLFSAMRRSDVPGHTHEAAWAGEISIFLYGSEGNDQLWGYNRVDTHYGNSGADAFFGRANLGRMLGMGGNDQMCGGADADEMSGGEGYDRMCGDECACVDNNAGQGATCVFTDADPSSWSFTCTAELTSDGPDLLTGGANPNPITAEVVEGQGGADRMKGSTGLSDLRGGSGDNWYWVNGGDRVFGGQDVDKACASASPSPTPNFLFGNDSPDELFSPFAQDTVNGEDADDWCSVPSTNCLFNLFACTIPPEFPP